MTTAVILDMALCGTSMLSGVIHRLGIPMVLDRHRSEPGKMEDLDVLESLSSEATFAQLCRERRGMDWGFKHPGAWRFPWLSWHLDDPVYFAIYKGPVGVSWRRYAQINGMAMLDTLDRMTRSVHGIEAAELPCHYLDYYEAVQTPLVWTRRVAAMLHLQADDGQIAHAAEWIKGGGYNDG